MGRVPSRRIVWGSTLPLQPIFSLAQPLRIFIEVLASALASWVGLWALESTLFRQIGQWSPLFHVQHLSRQRRLDEAWSLGCGGLQDGRGSLAAAIAIAEASADEADPVVGAELAGLGVEVFVEAWIAEATAARRIPRADEIPDRDVSCSAVMTSKLRVLLFGSRFWSWPLSQHLPDVFAGRLLDVRRRDPPLEIR
jgi:hypothetical protein